MAKRILLVGHCGVDGPRMQKEIAAAIPGLDVVRVNSEADLDRECEQGEALLLVNREPVGFQTSGLDIITSIRADHADQKVLLVSDLPEAQKQAEAAGALPGFGKEILGTPKFAQAIQKALA